MEDSLSSLKAQMGHIFGEEPPRRGWWSEFTSGLQLSFGQRVGLFAVFMALGLLFCGISTWFVISPTRFAKFYTIGSLFVVCGSCFLVGPIRQLKALTQDLSRGIAAVVYILAAISTLWAALSLQNVALTTLFVVIQIGSGIWYGASFIPFARSCIASTARTILPI